MSRVAIDKAWFDLRQVTRRTYARAVWVPLRLWVSEKAGGYTDVGHHSTLEAALTIAFHLSQRPHGEEYTWSSYDTPEPYAANDYYKPSDVYQRDEKVDSGIYLVMRQNLPGATVEEWHLHQDLVIALRLLREGDTWVRPEEGFTAVARLRRDEEGVPIALEIRSEHLRDYLCARQCALRIVSYRCHEAVLSKLGDIDFDSEGGEINVNGGRLEERAWSVDATGSPYGAGVAVFKVGRTDVDPDDDVPVMGPERPDNTDGESRYFRREGEKRWRVSSAYWRNEWVEPAPASPRVRRDDVPSDVTFIVDADGSRMNSDDLDNEDIGRWLWFKPTLVNALLERRGNALQWYTRDTGGLSSPGDRAVHFGLNATGLVVAYAHDVARLPEWERRFWSGFNVTPEGGISAELHSAQVRAVVADTMAPEAYFGAGIEAADNAFRKVFGNPLFRSHAEAANIMLRVHRFRVLAEHGLLSLAKDVARLTADAIDVGRLQAILKLPKEDKRRGLKLLEAVLDEQTSAELAAQIMAPLFAIYDLRLSDAHLPRSDLESAYRRLGIDAIDPPLVRGWKLLHQAVSSLHTVAYVLNGGQRLADDEGDPTETGT